MNFAPRCTSCFSFPLPRNAILLLQSMIRPVAILILTALTISLGLANAQCPPVGADTGCGAIITVTDAGASVSYSGQGPYDGSDDTLIGIINNSTRMPISSVKLQSGDAAFAFDGDGIDTYGIPGNGMDNTGYGGPNAYFSDISPDQTTGTVHFIVPIAANGGTVYFSLEAPLSAATACTTLINNALQTQVQGANICATFTPNQGYTLAQAEQLCNFKNFDWIQQVTTKFDPSLFYARNLGGAYDPTIHGRVRLTSRRVPWSDPPQGGGYTYTGTPDYSYPFYYDQNLELPGQEDGTPMPDCTLTTLAGKTLTFHDAPGDGCLPGGALNGTSSCDFTREPPGSYNGLLTHLAGIKSDGTAFDLGIGFSWRSTYNGTTGGVYVMKSSLPADGNGTGGDTTTNVNQVSSYQYPKDLVVTEINGIQTSTQSSQALLGGNQISTAVSAFTYNPPTQTYIGTITITNVSTSAIQGPFQIVFTSLTTGVVMTNSTGTFGGFPYLTVAGVSSLAPSQAIIVNLQFQASSPAIQFVPITYTGSLS